MGEKETMTGAQMRDVSGIGSVSEIAGQQGGGAAEGGIEHEDDWQAQRAANLNSSRSNRYAAGAGPEPDGEPAETAVVKSKSNITNNREAASVEPDPAASSVKSGKSNTSD